MIDFIKKKFFSLLFILMGFAAILVSLELIFEGNDLIAVKKEVKKYINENDSLSNYFGTVKSMYFPNIAINGDGFENFPCKSKVTVSIKGSKKHVRVLFTLEEAQDNAWIVSSFEIQE